MSTAQFIQGNPISEADLDHNILQIAEYVHERPDYGLYVHFGGHFKSAIARFAKKYNGQIHWIRPQGWRWLAQFIPSHEALLRLNNPETVREIYQEVLADGLLSTIAGISPDYQDEFLNLICQNRLAIETASTQDPAGFMLRFILTSSSPTEAIRWVSIGPQCGLSLDYSYR